MSVCFLGVLDQVSCHLFIEELTKTFVIVPLLFSYPLLLEVTLKKHFLAKISFGLQCRIINSFLS